FNEIELLRSKGLMQRVVTELNLEVSYFVDGSVKSTELYKNSPIAITINRLDSTAYEQPYIIRFLEGDQFELSQEDGPKETFTFGKEINRPYGSFTVVALQQAESGRAIRVQFNDLRKLAIQFNDALEIEPVNKDASVITISLVEPVKAKGVDIINKL